MVNRLQFYIDGAWVPSTGTGTIDVFDSTNGEVIGRIVNDPSKPGNRFEGYASSAQNESKILRDVFEKGDHWRLPKPFEVGTVFGTVPEVILDALIANADEPDITFRP